MPTRVAALYDIHGNLPALEAVLADVRRARVDAVVVGGDVLPGPMSRDTLAALRALDAPATFIMGNGDREVVARAHGIETEWYRNARDDWREPIDWEATQFAPADVDWIAAWPATCRMQVDSLGDVLFCHASPRNDTDCFTKLTPEHVLLPLFADVGADVVVCGHTHMQFDRRIGRVRVVNAGSVGMPFGRPGVYWLLLGADVEFRHTPYELEAAAARIRASGYPPRDDFAAHNVMCPPSEESMLAAFTASGLA